MGKIKSYTIFLCFFMLGCSKSNQPVYYYVQEPQPNICTCSNQNISVDNKTNKLNESNLQKENNLSPIIINEKDKNISKDINTTTQTKEPVKKIVTKDDLVKQILKNMFIADEKNKIYQATFINYSKGNKKDGKILKEMRETTIKATLTLKKPSTVLMNVIESPDELAVGSTLLYTGGDKIKVKAGGVLGLIPVSFNITDSMFENARGHSLLSAFDGLKRLSDVNTKIELLGTTQINDKKCYLLKVIPVNKLDPEITHELYAVDQETFIVLSNEMYVNQDLVGQYKVENIKINLELSDDYFKL